MLSPRAQNSVGRQIETGARGVPGPGTQGTNLKEDTRSWDASGVRGAGRGVADVERAGRIAQQDLDQPDLSTEHTLWDTC